MLEKEFISFGSGILASVFSNIIGDGGKKVISDREKKKMDQAMTGELDTRVRDCLEQEHVRDWIYGQEERIKQAGCVFNEEDRQRVTEDFFRQHPDMKYVHGRAVEDVLLKCMDTINAWADEVLSDENRIVLDVIKKDGQKHEENVIRQMEAGNKEVLRQIQELRDRKTAPEASAAENAENGRAKSGYHDEIQNLYRIQNYLIRPKDGYFIAEQRSGIIRIKALVIPVHSEEDELSAEEICRILEILGREGSAYQYIHIVSNGVIGKAYAQSFSPYKDKMEIFGERYIINGIMDFTGYLNDTISRYKNSSLCGHYIEVLDENTERTLEDSVRIFLQEEQYNAFLILGDYGCGKTSFLLNLAYQMAEEYCREENGYIPLFIPLKDYAKAVSMENLLLDLFVNKCHMSNVSIEAFKMMLNYMKFVLLFDGFDEVAKRVNYDVKFDIFNQICQFCGANTKIIITCRPNYFQENREYKRLMENAHLQFEPSAENKALFYETYIANLVPEQIHRYILSYEPLLRKEGMDAAEMEELIAHTHDLTDLSRRPFLLNIIVQTLPKIISGLEGKNKNDITINAASLYRNYTELWLDRENAKGKALIRKEDKLQFCMHIAYKMFKEDILSIHFSEMPDEIREYFPDLHQMDEIDYFSHDIQSCSFMNSEGDGYFKFIHKSFMEYFVACFIVGKLQKDKDVEEALSIRDISTEIALFINDILCEDAVLYQKIINILEEQTDSGDDSIRQNAVTLLSKMEHNIAENIEDGKSYVNGDFIHSTIARRVIRGVDFSGASFYNATIEEVQFIDCCFERTDFQKASIRKVDFSRQSLKYADLSYSKVRGCNFTNCSFEEGRISHAHLSRNNFMGCDMSGIEADGTEYENNRNCDGAIGIPYEMR